MELTIFELFIVDALLCLVYVLSRMNAGPPTGQTQLGSVPYGAPNPMGDTTMRRRHAPIASSYQALLEQPDEPDGNRPDETVSTATAPILVHTAKKLSKQVHRGGVQKPANVEPDYSHYDRTSADGLKKILTSLDISPGYYKPRLYCHDCFVYREEIKEAAKKMNLARKDYLIQDAQRNTSYGISWRRAICAFIEAKGAWYILGLSAKEHATKQCKARPENRAPRNHSREICPKRECDTQERTPPKDSAQSPASTSSSASIGLSPVGRDASVGDIAQAATQKQGPSTFDMGAAVPTQNAIDDNRAASDRMLYGQLGPSWQPRGRQPGDKPPVARAQTAAILEVTTTTPAPSLVAATSTSSTAAPPQDAMPSADTIPPGLSQVAAAQAVLTLGTHAQTAATLEATTMFGGAQAAAPQLAQRAIGMDVDVPAPHAVPELYPAGQGAIGGDIAHAAGQQQMPDAVDMDIEAPGQGLFVDNGPAVYDDMHVPAPQSVNNTLGMDVDTTEERAVAEYYPVDQGAIVGGVMRAPMQEQEQGVPGMDVDQGAITGSLAQEPAPQPANNTFGMDVDATEQNAVAELDPVGRDTRRPFAHWVIARPSRYDSLRAYLRKQRQVDRTAPYHIPTREQRRRLLRKWTEANNAAHAAAQQRPQSTLGASTAAPTQHAAIDSEAVVGENPAGQGAIEDDTVHAPAQQQPGLGVVNTNFLPRPTDDDHNDDGLPDYEHPDDSSTSLYWVNERRDFLDGLPDTDYDWAVEGMFRVLVNDSLEDARRKGVDNVGDLQELVAGHDETEAGYIYLPDEPAAGEEYGQEAPAYQNAGRADVEEYDPEAPAYGDAQVPAEDQFDMVAPAHGHAPNDADYSDAESETLTMDTASDPSDDEDEQG
ncbi:hypothetical protein GGI13_001140 [Coemansia sp. RSA 455]|nr:hypothetical protein GGI13_001140 [Coemansia sp. RSA 455]